MQVNINTDTNIQTDKDSWLDTYGVTRERADALMAMLKSKLKSDNGAIEFGEIHKGIVAVVKELLAEPSPRLDEIVFFIAKSGYSIANSSIDPLDQLLQELKGIMKS